MVGRSYWIAIWYGILFLGMLGLWSSVYWGRQTHWKNLDELLRAIGTIIVSSGMLLLLNQVAILLGQIMMVLALVLFVAAFILGRKAAKLQPDRRDDESLDDPDGPA